MSAYSLGYYATIVVGVFITSSLLAGAGITNPNWYPAPYLISRLLIVMLSMLGTGTSLTWCYKFFFKEKINS